MPEFDTRHFGRIGYQEKDRFIFPRGLPGFDEARAFLPMSFARSEPLIFLQSLEDPALCLITIPVRAAEAQYRLEMSREDLALLGLPGRTQPRIGEDVLCLAVVSVGPEGPTANLLAPVVVNLRSRQAVQALCPESGYSLRHPLLAGEPAREEAAEAVPC